MGFDGTIKSTRQWFICLTARPLNWGQMDLDRMWYNCPFEFGKTNGIIHRVVKAEFEHRGSASPWMYLLYVPRTDLTPLDEGLNEDL